MMFIKNGSFASEQRHNPWGVTQSYTSQKFVFYLYVSCNTRIKTAFHYFVLFKMNIHEMV